VPIFQRKRKKNERDTEIERGKKQRKTKRQKDKQKVNGLLILKTPWWVKVSRQIQSYPG
jgi:hypothetical protein